MMLLFHKAIVFLKNNFSKYPNIRKSAHIQIGVSLHKDTVVGKWSQINAPTTIGRNVFIGRSVHICGYVTIGNNVTIGHLTQIVTGDAGLDGFDQVTKNEDKEHRKPVAIEDNVCINHSATISKGVTLGKGCIVMMGASVFESVPAYAVVCGNPAKVIGYVKRKERLD